MSPKTQTLLVGVPVLLLMWLAALLLPLPYVTYAPGLTTDVLGERDGREIIQVTGHKTYPDDGQLRMTTVYVTQPDTRVNVFDMLGAFTDPERAVFPYASVYRPDETADEAERESSLQMVSSQDLAVAAALREIGYDLSATTKILEITAGMPADGTLKVGDELVRVRGREITGPRSVLRAMRGAEPGEKVAMTVLRDGKALNLEVGTRDVDGVARIGILPGPSYRFPFSVHVNIDPQIGGPSAGLMFALAIYDTLTPGSLTGEATIAGTGTIDEAGAVGPIGGITQKIVAARDDGARLFLVPPDNCDEALRAQREGLNESMRLVKATTAHSAVEAIETWTEDADAALPTCSTTDLQASR